MNRHSARALVQIGVGLEHDRADRDILFRIVLENRCELVVVCSGILREHVGAILNEQALVINRRGQETEWTAGPGAVRAKNQTHQLGQGVRWSSRHLVTTHTKMFGVHDDTREVGL